VAFDADVTLTPMALVKAIDGLTLNGTMTLLTSGNVYADVTSEAANLQFVGTQSLMGTGNILLNANSVIQAYPGVRVVGETPAEEMPDQQPIEDPAWSSSINADSSPVSQPC
jgi:hypothetical protein